MSAEHQAGTSQGRRKGREPCAGVLELVLDSDGQPVFVTGGPPRTPFRGPGASTWLNPAFAVHHARSWQSLLVLGAMLPLGAAAAPDSAPGARMLDRYGDAMRGLAAAGLPFVAQVWGPMTLAAQQAGVDAYVSALAGSHDVFTLTAAGLDATLASTEVALASRPTALWVAEPLAALADPDTLAHVWLPAMRSVMASARAAGTDIVVHVSGAAEHVLESVVRLGVAGLSVTAGTPLETVREVLPEQIVVFGNLDSMRLLDQDAETLAEAARAMVREMRGRPFVLTPGSGLTPRVTVERLAAFVDAGVRG